MIAFTGSLIVPHRFKMAKGKQKKSAKKIKVHYDRLIFQLVILSIFIFVCVWLFSICTRSCSSDADSRRANPIVIDAARRDVERVVNTSPSTMERDDALLHIRATEHRLRSAGYGHDADDYRNYTHSRLKNLLN